MPIKNKITSWQLKQELRAKTSTIRDQCKMEFDQELKKLKEEWSQECLKDQRTT